MMRIGHMVNVIDRVNQMEREKRHHIFVSIRIVGC